MSSSAPALTGVRSKSPVSIGTSDSLARTLEENPFPLPPPASSRPPRNCTFSATISTAERFCPSGVVHLRQRSRPSIATGRPFDRYLPQFSPWAPQTVTSKKLGSSSHWPVWAFLRRPLTATDSEQTVLPLGSALTSGSRVRLPVIVTRLMVGMSMAPLCTDVESSYPSLWAARTTTEPRSPENAQ